MLPDKKHAVGWNSGTMQECKYSKPMVKSQLWHSEYSVISIHGCTVLIMYATTSIQGVFSSRKVRKKIVVARFGFI